VDSQPAAATQDVDDLLAAERVAAQGNASEAGADIVFNSDPRLWTDDQVSSLLKVLRLLPPVSPLAGLRHPPRDMEQRWAAIVVSIMEWHAEACDKGALSESRRELADLLLYNF
jgi:hypothetical protein